MKKITVASLPKKPPYVAIIILNWNSKDDTLECLASISQLDYPNYKVIVVDNGSTDGSEDAIKNQYPDVILLQTNANLGYAGGNNVGIRWALEHGANYILILNNDTVVAPDLVNAFVNAAKIPPGSVLGAKIYYYGKPDTLWFAGGRWHSETNHFEHIGYNQIDSQDYDYQLQVDYITGCALFSSANTFKDVGLLDDKFFLTYEETDWCYRARAKGYKCFFIPKAKLWHKVSVSFGGEDSPLYTYFMSRNKMLWAKKHLSYLARIRLYKESFDKLRRIFLPPFILAGTDLPLTKKILWSFSSWLKTIKRNIANPTNKATWLGLRDYYLGRFGNCPDQVRTLGKSAS